MRAKFISETFSREEGDIFKKLGIGSIITLELESAIAILDEKGGLDKFDEDTKYLIDEIKKSGVKYKILGETFNRAVNIEFTGTKEQLLPIICLWDPYGRNLKELRELLKDWGKQNVNDLWDFLDPF